MSSMTINYGTAWDLLFPIAAHLITNTWLIVGVELVYKCVHNLHLREMWAELVCKAQCHALAGQL